MIDCRQTVDAAKTLQSIGDKIKQTRNSLGMTQVELADATGIAQRTISLIERGRMNISIVQATRIANALNIRLGVLVSED